MVDKKLLKELTTAFALNLKNQDFQVIEEIVLRSLEALMRSIPEAKKKSYGIVSVISVFCKSLHETLGEVSFDVGRELYRRGTTYKSVCLGLGILSHIGVYEPERILPYMKDASDHSMWEVKEFVQMFIRKITKVHKTRVQEFLLKLTQSDNPNHRRFASESLRPVVENNWINKEPEYALKVLRQLFEEKEEFPKVSVGNTLSDLSRKNPELILKVVMDLKALNNEASDWIAYRACRNLIKTHASEVFSILDVDCYRYKNRQYFKKDN